MKHWKRGLLAAVLCAALALGIAVPASGALGTVYLMAVNERVLETTAQNMPMVMGGVLYVPYTMLSLQDSGISLGVNAQYSPVRRTVLVSNGQTGIAFDVQNNTANDLQGNPVPARAVVRNSMAFLPIDYLCGFFGVISCSRVRTDYGTLIRVTNSAVVLQDADFVDAAQGLLKNSLRGYLDSIEPTAPPATTPPPAPAPSGEPSAPPIQAQVLLALRWGEQGVEIAQLLETRGERALFLFACDELAAQGDAVRRLAAAGHTVGLALTGEDAETCAAQLKEGRRLLAEIARYHAVVVSADALEAGDREALAQEGCALWNRDLRGEDYRSGTDLVEALSPQRGNFVELSCGAGSAAFLRGMFSAMEAESCYLRQVTAPLLG